MAENNRLLDTSIYTNQPSPLAQAGQAVGLAQGITQQQRGQVALDSEKIDLVHKQMGNLLAETSALAAKPDLSRQDFMDAVSRNVALKLIDRDTAVQTLSGLAKVGSDPNALRLYARQLHLQAMETGQRFGQIYGQPQALNVGDKTLLIRQGINGPELQGSATNGVSPEFGAGPAEIIGPDGRRYQTTQKQRVNAVGGAIPVGGLDGAQQPVAPPGQPRAAQPRAGAPAAQGRPQPGVQPVQPAPQQPRQAQAPGGLPGIAGPAPGAIEAATATGGAAGQQLAQERAAASEYQAKIYPLTQSITALEKLGPQGTGPGTEGLNLFKSAAISLGIPGSEKLTDSVADYDKAKKYLTDYVNQNGNSGTNDKLAAAFAGNPSVNISNAAAVDVAKSALALRRMKQAQLSAYERSGLPPDQYQTFASQWNAKQDPRAFGFDIMTPAAQKKLLDGLSGDERKRFVQSVKSAHEAGVLTGAK